MTLRGEGRFVQGGPAAEPEWRWAVVRRSRREGARLPWGSPSPLLSDATSSSRRGRSSYWPSPEVGVKTPSPMGPVPFPAFHRHPTPEARPCTCLMRDSDAGFS